MSPWHPRKKVVFCQLTVLVWTKPHCLAHKVCDSLMEEDEGEEAHATEGESLSNRPSSSRARKTSDPSALNEVVECTALPPCGVDGEADDI